MAQEVFIQITSAGASTGPFDLYSDDDAYTTPFETGIAKATLEGGYTSTVVPDGATILRVQSDNATCTNYQDVVIDPPVTTTTTTTTPVDPATSTLTFTEYIYGEFRFTLSNAIFSTDVNITFADAIGSVSGGCVSSDDYDSLNGTLVISAGSTNGSQLGVDPLNCGVVTRYSRGASIIVNGIPRASGQTITIGGTLVTISIPSSCDILECLL